MDSRRLDNMRKYSLRRARSRSRAACVTAAILLCLPIGAQLTSTIESAVEQAVEQQVQQQVQQQVEAAVQDAVEQQVTDQVEATVTATVEQEVAASVAQTVERQIESGVTQSLEQQIEAGVTQAVEQQIASSVTETLEQQIEAGVTETLEQQIEAGVTGSIADAVESAVEKTVQGGLEGVIEAGSASQILESAAGADASAESASADRETYAADVDETGRAIERDVWVVLVPLEHVARIEEWGFNIRERDNLDALGSVLLRVDAPEDRDIAQAALELALDAPGTLVDFNHVYRAGAEPVAADTTPHTGLVTAPRTPAAAPRGAAITVGIIDSTVALEHGAFREADIVQRDFVPFEAQRPTLHGTAVASILIGERGLLQETAGGARLLAAAVFFEDEAGLPAATTASLVAAIGWHASSGASVVNMSLAGPPNRVLEAAIGRVVAQGAVVVAAVGNNGPAGEPLYPAAYDTVVGVTAVDSAHRVYRYANRGRHVTFAAPGVEVSVAAAGGGYTAESGTSMAAPHAAAVIARSIAARVATSSGEVLEALKGGALDLGAESFDETYGFGLITAVDEPLVTATR